MYYVYKRSSTHTYPYYVYHTNSLNRPIASVIARIDRHDASIQSGQMKLKVHSQSLDVSVRSIGKDKRIAGRHHFKI